MTALRDGRPLSAVRLSRSPWRCPQEPLRSDHLPRRSPVVGAFGRDDAMAFLVGCSARHSQVNGLERLVYRITRTYGSVPSPRPAPDYFGELVAQAVAFVAEPVDRLHRSRQWSVVETPGCPTTIGAGRPGSITIGNHFAHALANEGEVCESTHGPSPSLLGDWSRAPPDVAAPGGPCRDPRGGS